MPARQTHNLLLTTARTKMIAEDFDGAVEAAREALVLGATLVPAGHPNESLNRVILAHSEGGRGRTDEALAVLRDGEAPAARLHGAVSRELLRLRRTAVKLLADAQRQGEADSLARETLALLPSETPAAERDQWRDSLRANGAKGL